VVENEDAELHQTYRDNVKQTCGEIRLQHRSKVFGRNVKCYGIVSGYSSEMNGIEYLLCLPTPYQPPMNGLLVNLHLEDALNVILLDLQTMLATDSEIVKNAPETIRSIFSCVSIVVAGASSGGKHTVISSQFQPYQAHPYIDT
jgi:hypothetical protein